MNEEIIEKAKNKLEKEDSRFLELMIVLIQSTNSPLFNKDILIGTMLGEFAHHINNRNSILYEEIWSKITK
jgi:hypothetical protein